MQRRGWLGLALIGLPLSSLAAQEKIVPPSFETKPSTKAAEPATKPEQAKPLVTQESTTGPSPTIVGEGGPVMVEEGYEYVPSFSERMAGLGEVLARPFSFSWWDDSRPVSNNLMTSDLEDPYWFKADLMFGRFKEAKTPPLITTSLPQASRGIIGNEGTRVLYGGNIDLETHLGSRMTAGFWLEPAQTWGLEGSYFFLANRTTSVRLDSQGDPLLAAPFFDVLTGQNSAFPIANEELTDLVQISGVVNAGAHSRIQGFEFNNIHNITRQPNRRLDWTWGYRYIGLDEAVFFNVEQGEAAPQGQQFGTQRRIIDDFGTANHFHGFNLGLRSQWYAGNWTFDVNGKLGFGANRNTVEISGLTQTATPPQFQLVNTRGGLYALNSNIGNVTKVSFSFVPEIEVGAGYYFAEHWRITCAYNFLAITSVVRPGDQIDNRINTNILDGNSGNPATPERFHKQSTFWLSSFSVGLEYRW
jgi:hypothetical protein